MQVRVGALVWDYHDADATGKTKVLVISRKSSSQANFLIEIFVRIVTMDYSEQFPKSLKTN